MKNKKNKRRLRWSLEDKKIIAQYQNQFDIFGQVRCKICGRSFPIDIMEVDHIKPISKGGTDQPSNLQLLCPACNRKKNKKTYKPRNNVFNPFDIRIPI
jgi:5-methylcytosine-specific restriction endonuclease McrA